MEPLGDDLGELFIMKKRWHIATEGGQGDLSPALFFFFKK